MWVRVRTASPHNLCFEQKYENIRVFLSENFQFLEVKFSIYLNRRVFVMNVVLSDANSVAKYVHQSPRYSVTNRTCAFDYRSERIFCLCIFGLQYILDFLLLWGIAGHTEHP